MNKTLYQPLGANVVPKFAGPVTFMRLPSHPTAENLDACFVGVPFDLGASNRVGTRFGPRQIRAESTPIRPYNMATRSAPFDSMAVADIGDVNINPYSLEKSIPMIVKAFDDILIHNCIPLSMGGDHTITLPILRAVARKHGAVGVVHVDAHADINDHMFGEPVAHGTPFRRAIEEGLIDAMEHSAEVSSQG
jgi:guanidinobutyrase